MAANGLSVLSGIAAAAAGLAGEKVSKNGSVPGLDISAIIPALLGNAGAGGGSGLAGTLVSAAVKSGVLKNTKLGNLAELAGSFISLSGKTGAAKTSAGGIAGLAAAIAGGTGSAANLGTIAALASKLGKTAKNEKELTGMASQLGKALSGGGISFTGSGTALKALDKVMENDTKAALFKAVLKGLS